MNGLVLCVVDDDDIYQFTTKKILGLIEQVDKVITFFDGEKAMEYLQENRGAAEALPDYVLLDINMPVMDGWDFLDHYKDVKGDLVKIPKIYLVSSSVHDEDINRANGSDDVEAYVVKPVTMEKVKEIIEGGHGGLIT